MTWRRFFRLLVLGILIGVVVAVGASGSPAETLQA